MLLEINDLDITYGDNTPTVENVKLSLNDTIYIIMSVAMKSKKYIIYLLVITPKNLFFNY